CRLAVDGAVAADGDGEEEVAVFGDDVGEALHDLLGGLVIAAFVGSAVVMPAADAGAGLPGHGADALDEAAFDILDDAVALIGRELLGGEHALDAAVPALGRLVIMRHRLQPGLAERD